MKWKQEAGRKPSKRALKFASKFAREKTGDHLVLAMAMRPHGVTQGEVISLLGRPHRNIIRKLVDSGGLKQVVLPDGTRRTRIKLVPRR